MRITDSVTAERLSVDEAYERFFDGFYNLGRPSEIFQRTVVLSPPKHEPLKRHADARTRRSGRHGRATTRLAGRK